MSLFRRYNTGLSERERFKIRVWKIYVIPLYIAWYADTPTVNGYGISKERAIQSLLKKEKR